MSQQKKELLDLIKAECVLRGDFTLKSGKKSNVYLDCRRLTLMPDGLYAVVDMICQMLKDVDYDFIGGPTVGADPIIGGMVIRASDELREDIRGFLVRGAEKDHGIGGRIVGKPPSQNSRVVMVEDVTTTGGSLLDAIDYVVETYNCKIVMAITIIDRLQGAQQAFRERNIPFNCLVTKEELGL